MVPVVLEVLGGLVPLPLVVALLAVPAVVGVVVLVTISTFHLYPPAIPLAEMPLQLGRGLLPRQTVGREHHCVWGKLGQFAA